MASSSVTPEQIKTIGELNREWFDSKADSAYSVPWIRDLCDQIIRFLREKVEWIGLPAGHELKMLDYACGNGTASVVRFLLFFIFIYLFIYLFIYFFFF
ncbi:hypothetical protein VTK73DRAFT_1941 [Phialemonium thermophilum]|uniref:Uncharacterized protein n=1 Tax=Phialemonium thermophilum TaxID=223376 RepID=A0ABR3VSZ6_9PEZI